MEWTPTHTAQRDRGEAEAEGEGEEGGRQERYGRGGMEAEGDVQRQTD